MPADAVAKNADPAMIQAARQAKDKILRELRKVIIGQEDLVERVLVALFAGGHILLILSLIHI